MSQLWADALLRAPDSTNKDRTSMKALQTNKHFVILRKRFMDDDIDYLLQNRDLYFSMKCLKITVSRWVLGDLDVYMTRNGHLPIF